jgi:ribosomal protein L24
MVKMKIKKNDLVKVITGDFRGLIDKIHHAEPRKGRIYLAKATRTQYDKSPQVKKKSVKKNILVPIHVSNVAIHKLKKSSKKA